jgi:2-polyprenyl-3-methyl-5-hydroxy-6-metoxy-1,4-benzoquinol methylase
MTTADHLDPTPILQMLQASQATAVLKSAIDLGVFAALAEAPRAAEAVAGKIDCPPRSTAILLDALAVLGLVARSGSTYELAPLARAFLVPGVPTYLGDASNIFAGPLLWEGFGKLTEAVRADGSVMAKHAETPSNVFWETFARSSAALAFPSAAALAEHLAPVIAGKKSVRVLDVAAGSGIYGYTLLRTPGTDVTFVDWPNVLEETRAWGDRLGVDRARAHYLPGSVFDADLGGPYDVVVASHLYHHFDPKTCQALTRRLAGVLAPGGRLAIHDFVTGPALENPGATMFSLVMLVWTRHGKAYSNADYSTWMTEAGLATPSAHPMAGMPTSWLIAERT